MWKLISLFGLAHLETHTSMAGRMITRGLSILLTSVQTSVVHTLKENLVQKSYPLLGLI